MFKDYREVAKMGLLKASAGRNWSRKIAKILCRKKHIRDVQLFPRIRGKKIVF